MMQIQIAKKNAQACQKQTWAKETKMGGGTGLGVEEEKGGGAAPQ